MVSSSRTVAVRFVMIVEVGGGGGGGEGGGGWTLVAGLLWCHS